MTTILRVLPFLMYDATPSRVTSSSTWAELLSCPMKDHISVND
jgi:hypothetical protein